MGNSPSSDLGGGSAHSSRDMRSANPAKEVERSSASRAPTHNEYTERPASQKPHNCSVVSHKDHPHCRTDIALGRQEVHCSELDIADAGTHYSWRTCEIIVIAIIFIMLTDQTSRRSRDHNPAGVCVHTFPAGLLQLCASWSATMYH